MWTNYSCCVQCAVPNISKRIYNAKKKWQSTRHRTVWEVLIWDPTLEKCWSYRHLSSPRWICCVTSNHTVLISCHPYHLFSPLYDSCLLLFPPGLQFHQTGDWWTCNQWTVAAHPQWTCYPHARLYTHEMTPSRSSPVVMESYNIAGCVCLYEVKGHSRTNDHGWPSSL